jgi:hypothetical protein
METFFQFLDLKGPAGSHLSLPSKTTVYFLSLKLQNLKKMKNKLIILGLMFLPLFIHAQTLDLEKCSDVVVLPKALYDDFQNAKGGLDNADREITRERGVLDDIQKRYLGCEDRSDVAAMRKQPEEALQRAETNRKNLAEAFVKSDQEVRGFIRDHHGRSVAYAYLDPYYGNWGRIVTMNFAIVDDKVVVTPTYYELPDPSTHL